MEPSHLTRYTQLALLFTRYGRKDFHLGIVDEADVATTELAEDDPQPIEPDVAKRASAFAEKLQEMGPTFVKFGQVLSTRPDVVPEAYIEKLEELQDSVDPFSFAEVETIVEEELGARISKLFADFDNVPVAAASLGQVHHAVLRDGRDVVVKVQRPNVRTQVPEDLEIFAEIASFLDKHSSVARKMNIVGSVRQITRSLLSELNYLHEARNIETFRRNLSDFPKIYIPAVIHDFTTSRVLTMELIRGKKVSKITPLEVIDHDYVELAKVLVQAYLKQITVDGFWHSDPHPGNVFVREDQIVLLDFGMVARIGGELQDEIVRLLLGISENRGEEVAEVCIRIGNVQEGFDRKKFVQSVHEMVGVYHDADLGEANVGRIVFQVIGVAAANELQLPAEMAMLAKTLLQIDGVTRTLDPEFNPREVIRDYVENLIGRKLRQKIQPKNYYAALLDLNAFALEAPRKVRSIVSKIDEGEFSLGINVNQIEHLLKAMTKIANRLTVGLVIAAMIIGSALVMRVPSGFRIFGYPGIAVIGFVVASALGLYLVGSILLQDRRDRMKARKPGG
jgi:ubiquinone biosynthesis protein